ncbi:MAG: 4-hydroxy-tetrahydrodipicolinate synthase [Clostridia bacterium]|nr:4-hydroxy-tetrahydrodipicolinate synthase [Clostridia bacterium]
MKSLFFGTGVAIVTPFKNGKVDYEAFKNVIKSTIDKGVKAIIVLGTTGEGVALSLYERKTIIEFAKQEINNKAKLIVGTGNNNFETCKHNTKMARDLGADGVLVVTPYYNKTTQNGLIEYYTQLSTIGIPIIMYNVLSRTGLNIETRTVKALIDNPMIYGLKEATCDINRIIELSNICKDKIALYSGEDNLNYVFYCLGGHGSISVTANICADKVQDVYEKVQQGNFKQALMLQNELTELNKALFIETNPIPVKTLMNELGMIEKEVRMPLVNATDENSSLLVKLAEKLKQERMMQID